MSIRWFAVIAALPLLAAENDPTPWRGTALTAPALPGSAQAHPVDRLVGAYFQANQVKSPPAVSDAQFARRAYLDLWGLLPTPEQTEAFVRDRNPGKHAALVDHLLADGRRYRDHWITFWNDHLRNDEGVVYHGDRKSITPWLSQALESNLSYDRFVQALVNPEEKTGPEGFLIGVNWRGDINASQTPVMQAAQNTAQIFLGVNLKCNSCHDSFISRWKLKDAYGLASFFSEAPLQIHRCDAPTGVNSEVKFLYPELGTAAADAPLAAKRAAAARLFTMKENGRTPRTLVNRYWKVLFGRAITEPVDDMDARPWSPELLDWLAADFASNGYDLRHLLRRIMTSQTYRYASAPQGDPKRYVFRGPLPRRLSAEQFAEAVSSLTGEWRLLEPRAPGPAAYAREWQLKSTPLERALGRPIRDQVITERITQPTTLQALEMVNGTTLANLLHRGAQRMLGELPASPEPLFDSGVIAGKATATARVDVTGLRKLWLVVQDVDSYDPAKTRPLWQFPGAPQPDSVPSVQVIDLQPGQTTFEAQVALHPDSTASDINGRVRFFVYSREPDPHQMLPVTGQPPVARPPALRDPAAIASRVYHHALGRAPAARELQAALAFGLQSPAGLEDFLWAIALSPEFQYVR